VQCHLHISKDHSFIHSGYFYSASSSKLLLRGASDYSMDIVWGVDTQAFSFELGHFSPV